jgi:two-component system, NarL family, invasion response regulator UvrY
MRPRSISVMLVDDHAVVREGYRRLLEKHEGITVVAEAADAAGAYQAYKNKTPDVVVMDVSLPGRGGIDAIRQIRQWDPAARLLVFTMHLSAAFALQAFRAGAKGFVTKSSPPELLVSAVCDVAAGRVAICPEISEALAMSRLQDDASAIDTLSPREFEILRMLLDGRSAEETAAAFNLSPKTVSNYHYAIKSKLSVSSDVELVLFGLRSGLIGRVEEREHQTISDLPNS